MNVFVITLEIWRLIFFDNKKNIYILCYLFIKIRLNRAKFFIYGYKRNVFICMWTVKVKYVSTQVKFS